MRSSDQVAAMLCPVCKVGLAMSDRQGVEIDYCQQCRGVWLDRGELDKIIERSLDMTSPPAPVSPQQPQTPWTQGARGYEERHDPRYSQRRKKSFFEDLFD